MHTYLSEAWSLDRANYVSWLGTLWEGWDMHKRVRAVRRSAAGNVQIANRALVSDACAAALRAFFSASQRGR